MLELISITKEYATKGGNTLALRDVSLRFPDYGMVFITGKSGSGKTTLLNVLGGLDGFDSGEIKLNGKSFANFTARDFDSYRNTFVGFIFQEYNLLTEYSVEKNVELALELQGKKEQFGEISKLLADIDVAGLEKRKPAQLSGGQKQRIAIARALVKNPQIILADEPTGALDSETGRQMMDLLKGLSKEKLVVVVSHDTELAEEYADRIIRVEGGRVVEDILLTEALLTENVRLNGECLAVKMASRLSEQETKTLVSAIAENKKILFTDKISVRERAPTVEPPPAKEQELNLIKSKMKWKSTLSLGVKSLLTKPVRLLFTVLLSVVAFAVFGLFDAIVSYNDGKVITSILRENAYSALPVYATYTDGYYDGTALKISQAQIDSLNADTGYRFRGVYDLLDTDVVLKSTGEREGSNSACALIGESVQGSKGWAYYAKEINGIITFDQSEIADNIIDEKGFGYEVVLGEYPVFTEGAPLQAGISSYMADSILFWAKNNAGSFAGKIVRSYEDLLGVELVVYDNAYTVTAIVDCGVIPAEYDELKAKENAALQADFKTFLHSGCYLNLFAPTGLVESLRQKNNRTVNYYADYAKRTQEAFVDGLRSPYVNKYYRITDVPSASYLFFDGEKTALAEDECLISLNDFTVEYLKSEFEQSTNVTLLNKIRGEVAAFKDATDDGERKQSFVKLLDYVKALQKETKGYANLSKGVRITSRSKKDSEGVYHNEWKAVGIYFAIDTDLQSSYYNKFEPLLLSSAGLAAAGITENQGIYSRAITPLSPNRRGARVMGDKMGQSDGLVLRWFENSVLETVAEQRETMEKALNLVLYLAVALAVFSVFMLFNYISLSIISKRQTIGILRTLGVDNRNVFVTFFIEAMLISLITAAFASVAAYAACNFVNTYLKEVMKLTLHIALFGGRQVLLITLGSTAAGVLSSLFPILKISKKKPVELIGT